MKTTFTISAYSFIVLSLLEFIVIGSASYAQQQVHKAADCNRLFEMAQYHGDGIEDGLDVQRILIDESYNVYRVYNSSVLSSQRKCYFYDCKLNKICGSDNPMGVLKMQYRRNSDSLQWKAWIENNGKYIDGKIVQYPRR